MMPLPLGEGWIENELAMVFVRSENTPECLPGAKRKVMIDRISPSSLLFLASSEKLAADDTFAKGMKHLRVSLHVPVLPLLPPLTFRTLLCLRHQTSCFSSPFLIKKVRELC